MELSARLFGLNYWSVLVPQALEGVGLGRAAVRGGAPLVRARRRAAGRGGAGADPGGHADVPVQQPRRAARAADDGGRVRDGPRGRVGPDPVAGAGRGAARLRVPDQDAAGVPGPARRSAWPTWSPGRPGCGTRIWQLLAGLGAVIGGGRLVGGGGHADARRRPARTSAARPTTASCSWPSATTASAGSTATRPARSASGRRRTAAVGGSFGGAAGLGRLFGSDMGGQISWLLPGRAAGHRGAGLAGLARPPAARSRTELADRTATWPPLLLWGGWLLVTGAVFSFMAGIIHPYYTVALAPAIAALTGIGAVQLWRLRAELAGPCRAGAGVVVTAGWSYVLLDRSPGLVPVAAVRDPGPRPGRRGAACWQRRSWPGRRPRRTGSGRRWVLWPRLAAIAAALAGPTAYSLDTAATAHTGALPTAGPAVTSAFGGPGGRGGPGGGRHARRRGPCPAGRASGQAGSSGGTGSAGLPGGTRPAGGTAGSRVTGRLSWSRRPGRGRAGGGLGGSTQVSQALTRLLERDASAYTWAAATIGSESAAPLQLATGQPIMSIGGFNGTDPDPDPGRVQAASRRAQDPLLRRRQRGQLRRRLRRRDRHHPLGRRALQVRDRRRRHRLQPDRPPLTVCTAPSAPTGNTDTTRPAARRPGLPQSSWMSRCPQRSAASGTSSPLRAGRSGLACWLQGLAGRVVQGRLRWGSPGLAGPAWPVVGVPLGTFWCTQRDTHDHDRQVRGHRCDVGGAGGQETRGWGPAQTASSLAPMDSVAGCGFRYIRGPVRWRERPGVLLARPVGPVLPRRLLWGWPDRPASRGCPVAYPRR